MTVAEPQTLPHTLAAPALARRYLASKAVAWPADLLGLVVLLTSELVTNAVVHGLGPVQLMLIDDGVRLRVEVSDGETGSLPLAPRPPDPVDASGRGLLIVDRLAEHWGYQSRRTPPGKIVWFELRRTPVG
jgi:anti-sigma regulatory factor (Ser/Thr protein kinase)